MHSKAHRPGPPLQRDDGTALVCQSTTVALAAKTVYSDRMSIYRGTVMSGKLRVLSDLHIEGQAFTYEYCGEDAVVLLGDIHTRNRLHTLLDQIPKTVSVYFVAGNHEYYHGVFEDVKAYHRGLEDKYSNFRFLDNERTSICGIPAYGGTMFSDWELEGPTNAWFAKQYAKKGINDFYCILRQTDQQTNRPWTIADHENEHKLFVDGLKMFLADTEGSPCRIVLTHFMPHPQCVHERYRTSAINPYFTSNMERYMGWDGYWLFGHGHDPFDFTIDGTRLLANPRGYGRGERQENPLFKPDFTIEL